MKILVVEDENLIREVEVAYLKQSGFSVVEAIDGEQAWEIFNNQQFDLIMIDINIPKVNGVELCKRIRSKSQIPVIMVTAKVEEIDELIGLESGADDYIKKPFNPSILIARVKSILRRIEDKKLEIGDLIIDPERMQVIRNGKDIMLTTRQFNILYTLARTPGKVFTRDEILDKAYDETLPPDVLDRTVDAHIKAIRKAIEDDTRAPKYVLTVIGKGYKFNTNHE